LYFSSRTLNGAHLNPGSFLAKSLYIATVSTKGRIVIGGIVTNIVKFLGIEPNSKDRVSGSEQLYQAAFEITNFVK